MSYRVQRHCMSLHVWSLEQCLTHSKRSVNLSSSYFQGSLWHGPKPCSSVLVTPHELWSGQATRSLGNWGDPRTQWGKGLRVWGLLTVVLVSFKGSRICIIILVQVNGRLQSLGSLRVRHDWATSLSLFTFMHWRRKWQPTPVFLPGESQGRGSLLGCHLWGWHRVGHDWSDLAAAAAAALLNPIFFTPEIYFLNILYVY